MTGGITVLLMFALVLNVILLGNAGTQTPTWNFRHFHLLYEQLLDVQQLLMMF
jgi:hypothetical protein